MVWFYLSMLVPIDLVFVYPQWHVQMHELLWWLPLAAALLVTAVLGWQPRQSVGQAAAVRLGLLRRGSCRCWASPMWGS